MIPDPDHITHSLGHLDELLAQLGWDQPPNYVVLRRRMSANARAQVNKMPQYAGIKDEDVALVQEPIPIPHFFPHDALQNLILFGAILAYPEHAPQDLLPPPEILDILDDDVAAIVFACEAVDHKRQPPEEVRILTAIDTTGTTYNHMRFRGGDIIVGRADRAGNKVGNVPTDILPGPARIALFALIQAICTHHLTPAGHELPPLPPPPQQLFDYLTWVKKALAEQDAAR